MPRIMNLTTMLYPHRTDLLGQLVTGEYGLSSPESDIEYYKEKQSPMPSTQLLVPLALSVNVFVNVATLPV